MTTAPYLWLGRPGQETLHRGVTHELAEQSADESYDRAVARPPCPACGKPIADKDWARHGYEDHGVNEMVRPMGKPDAREAFFVHVTAEKLAEKLAVWRSTHPGVGLRLSGEGFDKDRKLYWQKYRIFDGSGKAAS